MYTSELARHQHRVVLFRYNLDLRSVFGVVNTPVHNHAKPGNNVYSPLTKSEFSASSGTIFELGDSDLAVRVPPGSPIPSGIAQKAELGHK